MAVTPWEYFLVKQVAEEQKRFVNNSTNTRSYNLKRFLAHKVKVSPKELRDKFNNYCKPIFELQRKNEEEIRKLEALQKAWIETLE